MFPRLTIWTALTMTDIEYDEMAGRGIPFPGLNVTQTIGNGTETRLISTTDTWRMMGAGWLLYIFSIVFNFIFYKMHPSSPEMWTWGAEEELEEWALLVELEKKEAEGEFDVQT